MLGTKGSGYNLILIYTAKIALSLIQNHHWKGWKKYISVLILIVAEKIIFCNVVENCFTKAKFATSIKDSLSIFIFKIYREI